MDDNPVTIEGNNREVIEVGGEFGGFKENFNVHGKSFRLINLYDSNILYIGRKVNRSLDKSQEKVKVFQKPPPSGGAAAGDPYPPLGGHIVWQDEAIQKNRLRGTTPVDGQRKETVLFARSGTARSVL